MMQLRSTATALFALQILFLTSCFNESRKNIGVSEKHIATEIPAGELSKVADERGLSTQDVLAAAQTYVPSGGRDKYLGVVTTGSSGRLAIVGLPSLRILKYVGVFTPEPWQGFAYDDESKSILQASARDEIAYSFGLSGRPALSQTSGHYDGKSVFVGDGANARVAVVDLDDYEAKQIVTNPWMRSAYPGVAITLNSEYVLQTSAAPEILGGKWIAPSDPSFAKSLRGAATFWKTSEEDEKPRFDTDRSFTIELPPYALGRSEAGRGVSQNYFFTVGKCASSSCGENDPSFLEVIDWKKAEGLHANKKGHSRADLAEVLRNKVLFQYQLPAGAESIALSPSGAFAALAFRFGSKILLLDLGKIQKADVEGMKKDAYGVPTAAIENVLKGEVEVGAASVDLAFLKDDLLYATVTPSNQLLKIDANQLRVIDQHDLGFQGGKILLPGYGTEHPDAPYAVVTNSKPHGRYVSVGPVLGMNAELLDIVSPTLPVLYDMSVPQATSLDGQFYPAEVVNSIVRYKLGTDSRTSQPSKFSTIPGQEHIERNGHRVEVFGTLIRSHITPEIVEVNEGDVVSFHMTNLEQAQDQTHGFTVDTYNVHGSWEPGKTSSVTFVANRPGVFPYYCTEFCSALHLEMEGYLLVKPKNWKDTDKVSKPGDVGSSADAKKDYDAKMKSIGDTQKVIESVVTWLKEHDYAKDPRVKELAEDALEQLKRAHEIQPKIAAAVKSGDWEMAKLWAEQYFQYQVKCADAGLRAKKMLSEGISK